jgi:Ca-activated chloride channel family protein
MERKLYRWLLGVVVLGLAFSIFVLPAGTRAQEDERQEDASAEKTLSPYFFVKGDPSVDRLPLKDTNVSVAVSGVIADVTVKQTYTNDGLRPINATYVFPASVRAAVYSMRMKIGDDVIYAKIKEREQAKAEFEKAKQEGKSASLLEEHRPNVFSMNLANVMPGEQIEIELKYTELLVPTDGEYEFVYPTVVGPRYQSDNAKDSGFVKAPYTHEGQPPASTLHIGARIAAGMPITEISCTSHQIAPEWMGTSAAKLTLDEPNAFQGNRDFILKYKLAGEQIGSGLLLFQGKDENFFLYMAQPPARVKDADIPPREYIFVVDVSGSMEGFPINTAKKLLTKLIANLRPTDYFNVVLFSGDSTMLSPTSLQANQANLYRAAQLLSQQRGAGGTELLPALKQAMSTPRTGAARSVVLVTDGYISGEGDVFDYIRGNLGQSNVFSFGIGSSVNRFLIDGVAKAGGGEPFVVTDEKEADKTAEKFREYIQSPVLTNVKVKAEGFDTYDVDPGHLPDLLAQRPIIVFGKYRGSPSGIMTITGRNGQGEYSDNLQVSGIVPDEGNGALRYLWARSRIAELSDYGSQDIAESKVHDITNLGLKYNLLTKYTSFIAVREKVVNPNGDATDVDQPLPLPLGVSDMAVGDEPGLLWLLAAVGLGAGLWLIWRQMLGAR